MAVARRLQAAIVQPYHIRGQVVEVGVSVGVATSFADFTSADEMLRVADVAMYDAKRSKVPDDSIILADKARPTQPMPLRLAA